MMNWLKSWIWKSKEAKERKEEKHKRITLLPKTHYILTPVKILEWWYQDHQKLDPLPPYPESPR